jgi:hypothetical protein
MYGTGIPDYLPFLICSTVTAKSVTSYQVQVPDSPPFLLMYNSSTIPPQTPPPHPSHHHFLSSYIQLILCAMSPVHN